MFVLAGLLVVGSTVVASRVSRPLVDPLTALTRATDRMSTGAVDVSAPVVESPREVRDLALSFNRMQERLRELRQSDLGRLHAAQQLSDAAIDSLYDPVIVTDVGGRVTRVNRAAVEAFGPETAAWAARSPISAAASSVTWCARRSPRAGRSPTMRRQASSA